MVDLRHQSDGDLLKQRGNLLYSEGRYADAVEAYNSAIIRNPDNQAYYLNRAMAHYKLKQYERTISDCEIAMGKGSGSIKAYYYCGLAQTETGQLTASEKNLKIAYDMAINTRSPSATDIFQGITACRRKAWEKVDQQRKARAAPLMIEIEQMYREKYNLEVEKARASFKDTELQDELQYLYTRYEQKLEDLGIVFERAGQYQVQEDAPDYLIDPITFELFVDPVIAPSGNSYERSYIVEHLKDTSKTDPLTRGPLTEMDLIPNRRLKEAADAWREKHGLS